MTGSWLIGPTHDGPPDPYTRCDSCLVDLEAGEDHEAWCDVVVWGERETA